MAAAAAVGGFVPVFLQDDLRRHLAQFLVMVEALRLRGVCGDLARASSEHIFWTRDVVIAPAIRMRDLPKFHGEVHTAVVTSQGRKRLCAVARQVGPVLRRLTVRATANDSDPAEFLRLVLQKILCATPQLESLAFAPNYPLGLDSTTDFAFLACLPRLTAIHVSIEDERLFAALWPAIGAANLRLKHLHVLCSTTAMRRFSIGSVPPVWYDHYVHFLQHSAKDLVGFTIDAPTWHNFGDALLSGMRKESLPKLRMLRVHSTDCLASWPGSLTTGCRAMWTHLLPQLHCIEVNVVRSWHGWGTLRTALQTGLPTAARLRCLRLVVRRFPGELDGWLVPSLAQGRLPMLRTIELHPHERVFDFHHRAHDARYVAEMRRALLKFGVRLSVV